MNLQHPTTKIQFQAYVYRLLGLSSDFQRTIPIWHDFKQLAFVDILVIPCISHAVLSPGPWTFVQHPLARRQDSELLPGEWRCALQLGAKNSVTWLKGAFEVTPLLSIQNPSNFSSLKEECHVDGQRALAHYAQSRPEPQMIIADQNSKTSLFIF